MEACGGIVCCHCPGGELQPILSESLLVPMVIRRLSLVLTCTVTAIITSTRDTSLSCHHDTVVHVCAPLSVSLIFANTLVTVTATSPS